MGSFRIFKVILKQRDNATYSLRLSNVGGVVFGNARERREDLPYVTLLRRLCNLPIVTGTISPYPTLLMVTTAHQHAAGMLTKSVP